MWIIFGKSLENLVAPLKLTRIIVAFHEDRYKYFCAHIPLISSKNDVSDKVVEEIKTHILCSVTFFNRKSSCLCDNVESTVESDRSQVKIFDM
jgi:hypothetical protein